MSTTLTRRAISLTVKSAVEDARRHFVAGLQTCGTTADLHHQAETQDDAELWEWIVRNLAVDIVPIEVIIGAIVPVQDEAGVSQLIDIYSDQYIDTAWDLMATTVRRTEKLWGADAGRRW